MQYPVAAITVRNMIRLSSREGSLATAASQSLVFTYSFYSAITLPRTSHPSISLTFTATLFQCNVNLPSRLGRSRLGLHALRCLAMYLVWALECVVRQVWQLCGCCLAALGARSWLVAVAGDPSREDKQITILTVTLSQ